MEGSKEKKKAASTEQQFELQELILSKANGKRHVEN